MAAYYHLVKEHGGIPYEMHISAMKKHEATGKTTDEYSTLNH